MYKSITRIMTVIFISLLSFVLYLPISIAAPVEVTFFPSSARVTERTAFHLQPSQTGLKKAVFAVAGQADPETLMARVAGKSPATIEDISWRRISSPQDEELIKSLKKKIDTLKEERIRMQSSIKSLETQIQFWQMQTKAKFKTLSDAANMSAALGKNIKKAMIDKLSLEPELEKTDKRIAQLQEDLQAAGGKKETAWEFTVLLSGTQGNDLTLSYTYTLAECGWTPLYRLEAHPLKKEINFTWEGEIWQSSGQDWNQVTVSLANRQPRTTLLPYDLPPWVIAPRYIAAAPAASSAKKAKAKKRPIVAEMMADADANAVSEPSAPLLKSEGAYTSWSLGKRFIPAGTRQKVKVMEETWPAEFTHLSRPSQDEQVFVRAVAKFDEAREIPQGTAVYLIDGAIIGKRSFTAASREETIFFGTDPMVKAKSVLLSKKGGEKNLFNEKQTYAWDWRIDIDNNRNYPIAMRIEEPIAQSRDERIKITSKHDPEPSTHDEIRNTWLMDIPAKEKRRITTGVFVEAPKDLSIDLGWRR
jgi:uncharacterized protein (TIGR02231 family)